MRNERKATKKQMLFKLSGKFDWITKGPYTYAELPHPRNVQYFIQRIDGRSFTLSLFRLRDHYGRKKGPDITIGSFDSIEEAKSRAELREARYEVKKATMEAKYASMEKERNRRQASEI